MRNRLFILFVTLAFTSCSCDPEDVASFAFKGMETFMGAGFMPSEEIRALGKFQGMSVNLSHSSVEGEEKSTIFLKLENGDPVVLGNQPEILARKCAELYLEDFENSVDYNQITVQFLQSDPSDRRNVAMQEYTFEVKDF